jgi:hypothetical protein
LLLLPNATNFNRRKFLESDSELLELLSYQATALILCR